MGPNLDAAIAIVPLVLLFGQWPIRLNLQQWQRNAAMMQPRLGLIYIAEKILNQPISQSIIDTFARLKIDIYDVSHDNRPV